jgi:signal transduction histidine kinase
VRGDESVPGQGIGLAVTHDILGAYDGSIHIARSALGGAAVALIFPSAGATAPASKRRG